MDDTTGLLQIGIGVLKTAIDGPEKRLYATLGDFMAPDRKAQVEAAEVWQHVGFISIPSNADPGKDGPIAIMVSQGGIDAVVATQDSRGLELKGNMKPGETCIYAPGADGKGQARVLLKGDGSISLYSRKGNVTGGAGMLIQMDAAAGAIRLVNDQGYGLIIDGDGVKLTSGGAALTLTGAGDARLIGKGQAQVDGSSVAIGSVCVPVVNAALTGPTGIAGKASVKVLIEIVFLLIGALVAINDARS